MYVLKVEARLTYGSMSVQKCQNLGFWNIIIWISIVQTSELLTSYSFEIIFSVKNSFNILVSGKMFKINIALG